MTAIRFLTETTAFEFDKEAGDIYFYCLSKEDLFKGFKIVGTKMLEHSKSKKTAGEWTSTVVKSIFFKCKLSHLERQGENNSITEGIDLKDPCESIELANGTTIKTWGLFKIGNSIPDISTYWYATLNNSSKIVSWASRSSCWRSDDGDYDAWVSRLKVRFSEVKELATV